MDDLLRIARSQEAVDRQLKQYGTDRVNHQLTDQVNAVLTNRMEIRVLGKERNVLVEIKKEKKCPACD